MVSQIPRIRGVPSRGIGGAGSCESNSPSIDENPCRRRRSVDESFLWVSKELKVFVEPLGQFTQTIRTFEPFEDFCWWNAIVGSFRKFSRPYPLWRFGAVSRKFKQTCLTRILEQSEQDCSAFWGSPRSTATSSVASAVSQPSNRSSDRARLIDIFAN